MQIHVFEQEYWNDFMHSIYMLFILWYILSLRVTVGKLPTISNAKCENSFDNLDTNCNIFKNSKFNVSSHFFSSAFSSQP